MTNRHGKNRSAKRRMGHKRPAPSDRLPEIDPPEVDDASSEGDEEREGDGDVRRPDGHR